MVTIRYTYILLVVPIITNILKKVKLFVLLPIFTELFDNFILKYYVNIPLIYPKIYGVPIKFTTIYSGFCNIC